MLKFTVSGQPVPYLRTTQRAKFCAKYKVYQQYKDHVVNSFLQQCKGDWGTPKPLTTVRGEKTKLDIVIYFRNYAHGDPDNIFKGCADALFAVDKYLIGSFDYFYDSKKPRVEITIS